MIEVTESLVLRDGELVEVPYRAASGPGGQNVNKVATAVRLSFDAAGSPSLPDAVRERLLRLAGRRASSEGVVTVTAMRHRSLERNREEARARMLHLIREAAAPPPPPRRATRVPLGQKRRRLEGKAHRAVIKKARAVPRGGE